MEILSTPGGSAVKEALRIGYRHFDCAHIYGNEAEIGIALAEAIADGIVTREELWITSKLWNDVHAPDDVLPALRTTLENLQLDYLDLYLIHWPVALKKGVTFPRTAEDLVGLDVLPLTRTWNAMEDLVDAGLVRHIGVSNFSALKIAALVTGARRQPEMNQVELHPYLQQNDLLALCTQSGIHVTAYSPLGSPDRPADRKATNEPAILEDPVIHSIARRRGVTAAQVLICWAIQRGTAVIPKSVNPLRMAQNFAAVEVELTQDDMREIRALDRHRRYVTGKFWALEGSPYSVADLWDE